MLELNAAPTPSAIVAAAPAPEAPAGNAAAGNADGEAAAPFATVLQGHMKQPQDSKAAKTDTRKEEAAAAAAVQPPVDALAVLAPMLAGLMAAPTAEGEGTEDAAAAAQAGSADPLAIAAPLLPGTALAAAPGTVATADASARQGAQAAGPTRTLALPADVSATPTGDREAQPAATNTGATQPASAILAAAATTTTESAAETGKSAAHADNFATLLSAAQGTQILAAHGSVVHRDAAPETPAATTVTTPVGAKGWDGEIGEKLSWMVSRQETRAELVLNPPHMGRIEVSLTMNGDQANAVFVSANPAVREALENAVPRLREVLQDAGISLGQTQVGAESFQQQAGSRENGDNPARNGTGGSHAIRGSDFIAGGGSPTQWLRQGNGLVDTFA